MAVPRSPPRRGSFDKAHGAPFPSLLLWRWSHGVWAHGLNQSFIYHNISMPCQAELDTFVKTLLRLLGNITGNVFFRKWGKLFASMGWRTPSRPGGCVFRSDSRPRRPQRSAPAEFFTPSFRNGCSARIIPGKGKTKGIEEPQASVMRRCPSDPA
jgi:hypothetical protein